MEYIIVLVVIIVVGIYFWRQKGTAPVSEKERLRRQCKALLNLPPEEADKTLDRLIKRQKEKNPGQSETWYLDKILYDLQKDK